MTIKQPQDGSPKDKKYDNFADWFWFWWYRLTPAIALGSGSTILPAYTYWQSVGSWPDPIGVLIQHFRATMRYCLYLGLDGETHDLIETVPDSPLLVIGPPGANKSAGPLAINSLLAVGALLCTSIRVDLFRISALVRARVGTVYNFSAYGKTLPGAIGRRFSPLQGCETYTFARSVAARWASFIDTSESALISSYKGSIHFTQRATAALAPILFLAALTKRDMGWVYRSVIAGDLEASFKAIHGELKALAGKDIEGAAEAAAELAFIVTISPEERGSILTTMANALRGYADPVVVAHSLEPDMDFDAFVRGRPEEMLEVHGYGHGGLASVGVFPRLTGAYDSIYITEANAEDPAAFIYLDFQDRCRDAAARYAEELEVAGKPRAMPLTWINDELAMLAPSRMAQTLAQGRDRGMKSVHALQSLAQAELIWHRIGEDFLSLYRTAVIFRGVKDQKTLHQLSLLAEKYWVEVQSSGKSYGVSGEGSSSNTGWQYQPTLEPDQIARGHPAWPDGAMVLEPGAGISWIDETPYYRGEPWARLLINSAEKSLVKPTKLPLPPLSKDGDYSHLEALGLADRFRALQQLHSQF